MQKLEHRIPPPLLMILTAAAMWGVSRRLPGPALPPSWRYLGSAVLGVLALTMSLAGFRAFWRARTTINPVRIEEASSLVTTGVFSVSRNPMYVALTSLLTGWAFWLSAFSAFAGPLAFALFIQRFQIIPEERVLQAKFGHNYEDYRQRVRRWL
jgi:protein-S-isoprenylcysteine O-methyltransferase Ste14